MRRQNPQGARTRVFLSIAAVIISVASAALADALDGGPPADAIRGALDAGAIAAIPDGVSAALLDNNPDLAKSKPICPLKPVAPEEARRQGIQGLVLVSFVVQVDGQITDIELRNPKAPAILFEAVKDWLQRCPYKTPFKDGQTTPVKLIVPFTFKLSQ